LPHVQALQNELKDREDVVILAHNTGADTPEFIGQYFQQSGFTFTPVLDAGAPGTNVKVLGARFMPCNVVVGPDGKVLHASVGFNEPVIRRLLGLPAKG